MFFYYVRVLCAKHVYHVMHMNGSLNKLSQAVDVGRLLKYRRTIDGTPVQSYAAPIILCNFSLLLD